MPKVSIRKVYNSLIQSLPLRDRTRILSLCEPVDLTFGMVLSEASQPFRFVYFPLTAFISLVTSIKGHKPLEMGMIGSEGMVGATVALGIREAPLRCVVQGAGTALRMSALQFQQHLIACTPMGKRIDNYLYVLMAQLSQTAACIQFHEVEPRLARWLLMTHDRAHADHFHLTHQFLAGMLGVRRSSISTAAAQLQRRGLIQYTRGTITITDRAGLEACSCECYAIATQDYARMLG